MRILGMAIVLTLSLTTVSLKADDAIGEWATQGYSARVRIASCVTQTDRLCGTISWLWEPVDASGVPMQDRSNPSMELRNRPLVGLMILNSFHARDAAHWENGVIYDPESGRSYKASLTLRSTDMLEVEGCVLFVCRKQLWRRARSICT